MSKYITRSIRYILPLVVLLLVATYLILSPVLSTHAAAPAVPSHVVVSTQGSGHVHPHPDWYWRP